MTAYVGVSEVGETTRESRYYYLPDANCLQTESALIEAGFQIEIPMTDAKYRVVPINIVKEQGPGLGSTWVGGGSRSYYLPDADGKLIEQTLEQAGFQLQTGPIDHILPATGTRSGVTTRCYAANTGTTR